MENEKLNIFPKNRQIFWAKKEVPKKSLNFWGIKR
jgi:hypothetical protein